MSHKIILLHRLLEEVWPKIALIRWQDYGTNYALRADVPKYTGILAYSTSTIPDCVRHKADPFGFLPDPGKSAKTVLRKIEGIEEYSVQSSIQVRCPPSLWGGAILSSDESIIHGITGLPEIGDHLVAATAMRRVQLLEKSDYDALFYPWLCGIEGACENAGMSLAKFADLQGLIYHSIMDHSF